MILRGIVRELDFLNQRRGLSLFVFIQAVILFVLGCSGLPKYPTRGQFGPFPINTTVDDPVAKRYLEAGLSPSRSLSDSEQKSFRELSEGLKTPLPTYEELQQISKTFSVDFASLFFAKQLLEIPKNTAAHLLYFHYLSQGETAITEKIRSEYVMVLVPGYDHVELGMVTGANLSPARLVLDRVKMKNLFVNLNPLGTVEENAALIADLIHKRTRPDQKVLISGASSGGAAIYYALTTLLPEADLSRVKAWINLGGLMNGSRAIDIFNSGWRKPILHIGLALTRWNGESLFSMSAIRSQKRLAQTKLDPRMTVLNLIGLSLSGSITDSEFSQYGLLRDLGPNDGFSLLPEMILPDTLSLIAPECDHFFGEDPNIQLKALALIATAIDISEQRVSCPQCWGSEGPFPTSGLGELKPSARPEVNWDAQRKVYEQLGK